MVIYPELKENKKVRKMAMNKITPHLLFSMRKTPMNAKNMIDEGLEDGLAKRVTCCEWFAKLKKGEFNVEDKSI